MSTVISLIPASAPAVPLALTPYAQRTIQRALNLLDKHLRQPGVSFLSATETRDWLRLKMACETLFTGTINHTEVHPREIVKAALRHNAAAVILAHNHPSGMAEPSRADRLLTSNLQNTLLLVDVRVLDHLIIGHREIVSFAERGWL